MEMRVQSAQGMSKCWQTRRNEETDSWMNAINVGEIARDRDYRLKRWRRNFAFEFLLAGAIGYDWFDVFEFRWTSCLMIFYETLVLFFFYVIIWIVTADATNLYILYLVIFAMLILRKNFILQITLIIQDNFPCLH